MSAFKPIFTQKFEHKSLFFYENPFFQISEASEASEANKVSEAKNTTLRCGYLSPPPGFFTSDLNPNAKKFKI